MRKLKRSERRRQTREYTKTRKKELREKELQEKRQTILKDVDFTGKAKIVGDLTLNANMLMSRVGDVNNRTISQSVGASDFSITQLYGANQKNKISLADNGDIVFYVGSTERLRVNSSGIVTPNISTSSQSSADIVISSNDIYRGTGTLDS